MIFNKIKISITIQPLKMVNISKINIYKINLPISVRRYLNENR